MGQTRLRPRATPTLRTLLVVSIVFTYLEGVHRVSEGPDGAGCAA